MNDEFADLGLLDDGDNSATHTPPPVQGAVKDIDPEDDRENWPTIMINTEEGKPNYETIIVHGTKRDGSPFGHDLQIMRGVPVKVPPSAVYDLQDAVSTHVLASKDRDGKQVLTRQPRPSVSWHLLDKGKYIK